MVNIETDWRLANVDSDHVAVVTPERDTVSTSLGHRLLRSWFNGGQVEYSHRPRVYRDGRHVRPE